MDREEELASEEALQKKIAHACSGIIPINIKSFFRLIVIGFNIPDGSYVQLSDIDKTLVINAKIKNVAMNNEFHFYREATGSVSIPKYGTLRCKELEPLSALLRSTANSLFQIN